MMPMFYGGYGMGGMFLMMILSLGILGLVVYWAVYKGVSNALAGREGKKE